MILMLMYIGIFGIHYAQVRYIGAQLKNLFRIWSKETLNYWNLAIVFKDSCETEMLMHYENRSRCNELTNSIHKRQHMTACHRRGTLTDVMREMRIAQCIEHIPYSSMHKAFFLYFRVIALSSINSAGDR